MNSEKWTAVGELSDDTLGRMIDLFLDEHQCPRCGYVRAVDEDKTFFCCVEVEL